MPWRCLLSVAACAVLCSAVEPLPTAGAEHQAVVAALSALRWGSDALVRGLPRPGPDGVPAITDPADPDLARRWTELVPPALRPGPAPSVAESFDRGRLIDVLLIDPADPRAAIARSLLGLDADGLPQPSLPSSGNGRAPASMPPRLVHGDGWLFGLDAAGAVRWQRRIERLARVAVGDDGALIAETAGLAHVDLQGLRRMLSPLPAFARPLATHGRWAWFHAGAEVWRLDLSSGAATPLTLPQAPLGPPLQRGEDAWWLTATELITTRGGSIVERMPHLLHLSQAATVVRDPRGGVVRDGPRWWLIGDRAQAAAPARIEALLLAGHRAEAAALLAATPGVDHDLTVRVTLQDPRTDQQRALIALAGDRSTLDALPGNPLLCEAGTDLALPVEAWPQRTTLAAWKARIADSPEPAVQLASDGITVTVTARWSAERWWQRQWPMRPLLDAPGRSWALVPGAVAVVDGASHLLLADAPTGMRIVELDLPVDVEPTLVARRGDHRAAVLAEQGRLLLLVDGDRFQRLSVPGIGRKFIGGAVELIDGTRWTPPGF